MNTSKLPEIGVVYSGSINENEKMLADQSITFVRLLTIIELLVVVSVAANGLRLAYIGVQIRDCVTLIVYHVLLRNYHIAHGS